MLRTEEVVSRQGIEHVGEPEGRSHLPTELAGEATSNEVRSGKPPGNRTLNQQIKSLLERTTQKLFSFRTNREGAARLRTEIIWSDE